MKKIIAIIALMVGCYAAQAQTQTQTQNAAPQKAYFFMENGKLMVNDWGHVRSFSREMALHNNAKVTPEGYVISAEGKKTKLKDGECVYEDGIIAPMPAVDHDKLIYHNNTEIK